MEGFTFEAVKTYTFDVADYVSKKNYKERSKMETYTAKEAHDEIHKLMKKYAEENSVAYDVAYPEVLRRNPELARAYTGQNNKTDGEQGNPSAELHNLVNERRRESHYQLTYEEALEEVQNDPANAELMKQYAFGG